MIYRVDCLREAYFLRGGFVFIGDNNPLIVKVEKPPIGQCARSIHSISNDGSDFPTVQNLPKFTIAPLSKTGVDYNFCDSFHSDSQGFNNVFATPPPGSSFVEPRIMQTDAYIGSTKTCVSCYTDIANICLEVSVFLINLVLGYIPKTAMLINFLCRSLYMYAIVDSISLFTYLSHILHSTFPSSNKPF